MPIPKPNTKVAAIALPEPLVRLSTCFDHAATITSEAGRTIITLYRFVKYASPLNATGLYRRDGQVVCATKSMYRVFDQLWTLYPDLKPAHVA